MSVNKIPKPKNHDMPYIPHHNFFQNDQVRLLHHPLHSYCKGWNFQGGFEVPLHNLNHHFASAFSWRVARSLSAPFLIVFHVFFWHVRRRNNHNHQPHPHWHHPCYHHANYHHHHPVWPQLLPIIILIFIILSTKKTHHNLITEVRLASNSIAGTSVIWPMWLL